MFLQSILHDIEKNIHSQEERGYFWTHSERYKRTLEEVERIAGGKKLTILDIGCFPYHVGAALEKLGHTVYGIASEHEPVKNEQIVICNIETEKFPFKNNFFDVVLCNEVIEHLPQSPVPALRECLRITKSNGYLMVTTPNIARSINRLKLRLGKNIMYPVSVYFENGGKGNNIYHRHNREYILSELVYLFEKTGWKIAKRGYFISYTPMRKRMVPDSLLLKLGKYANYFLMLLFPFYQDTLFVVGKKA